MLAILAGALVLANIAQPYPDVAPLQHIPTVVLLLAAPFLLRRWPLSDGAVAAGVGFCLLHTLAGRYTYSNVPYDAWSHLLTGHTISEAFGLPRNEFDRLVHLVFGILAVPVYAEASERHAGATRRAALWNALLFVGMVSATYEIFEWLLTMVVAPDMAADYNGQQGDPWDAQKDMAMAIVGAVFAVVPRSRKAR
jgi:putative membrane protein